MMSLILGCLARIIRIEFLVEWTQAIQGAFIHFFVQIQHHTYLWIYRVNKVCVSAVTMLKLTWYKWQIPKRDSTNIDHTKHFLFWYFRIGMSIFIYGVVHIIITSNRKRDSSCQMMMKYNTSQLLRLHLTLQGLWWHPWLVWWLKFS